jgi:hypothetical protein
MDDYRRAGGVAVIRCTVMDPFMATQRGKADFIEGFVDTLRQVFRAGAGGGVRCYCTGA